EQHRLPEPPLMQRAFSIKQKQFCNIWLTATGESITDPRRQILRWQWQRNWASPFIRDRLSPGCVGTARHDLKAKRAHLSTGQFQHVCSASDRTIPAQQAVGSPQKLIYRPS